MKSIPVDVGMFAGFACVMTPEPRLVDRATGEVRKDRETGQTLYQVGVVAIRGRDSAVIQVSVVGEPHGLAVGSPVRLVGLEASPWEIEGRSGVTFRAASIAPITGEPGTAAAGGSAAGGSAAGGTGRRSSPPAGGSAAVGGSAGGSAGGSGDAG